MLTRDLGDDGTVDVIAPHVEASLSQVRRVDLTSVVSPTCG